MQGIVGILAFPYLGLLGWLGYSHAAAWWPLLIAVFGIALYFGARPNVLMILQRGGAVTTLILIYASQAILAFIAFGIGWAIGAI